MILKWLGQAVTSIRDHELALGHTTHCLETSVIKQTGLHQVCDSRSPNIREVHWPTYKALATMYLTIIRSTWGSPLHRLTLIYSRGPSMITWTQRVPQKRTEEGKEKQSHFEGRKSRFPWKSVHGTNFFLESPRKLQEAPRITQDSGEQVQKTFNVSQNTLSRFNSRREVQQVQEHVFCICFQSWSSEWQGKRFDHEERGWAGTTSCHS